MRKWTLLALAACLLLCGCGKQAAPAEEEAPQAAEPWRGAYIAFLEGLCEREKELQDTERPDYDPNTAELEIGEVSGRYVLYDMDKDAVPELLIRYGMGEAGYHTTVYGYRDGAVAELGDIPTGHTSLYTWPGENGLAYNWSHMGGHFIDKITLEDGELVQTAFFQEGMDAPADSYTAAEDVIPGSRYLKEVPTTVRLPELSPMTLPIKDYGKVPLEEPLDPDREDAARAAITEVLENGGTFYAVSADGFGGDAGETTLETYLQPGGITEYADLPLSVTKLAWVDADRDGASECLLQVENNGGDDTRNIYTVVLSAQAGGVYGYCLNYTDSIEVLEDGVFRDACAEGGSWGEMRISFRENQCYLYTAPETSTASAVTWEEPPKPPIPDLSYTDFTPAPWQEAYISFLRKLCREEPAVLESIWNGREPEAGRLPCVGYWLYDWDGGGTPELFIQFGTCEADYYLEVYTFQDGDTRFLIRTDYGHSCLYSSPEPGTFLINNGHMGYGELRRVWMENGEIRVEILGTENINGTSQADYTPVEDIVPGAEPLDMSRLYLDFPAPMPMTLPIYAYGREMRAALAGEAAEAAIQEVLAGERLYYGVSGADWCDGDTGWTMLVSTAVERTAWVDLNGDGQQELLAVLGESVSLAFSFQEGTVYGYALGDTGAHTQVGIDGVLREPEYPWAYGLRFYKNQCDIFFPAYGEAPAEVTWETR